MKKNMGSVDKIIRVLIAVVIAVLYWQGIISGTLAIILLVLGIVFLLTSLINFCPLYTIFGINTSKKE
ncbi:YgaP family membrane protein [Lutibacter sp.]